MKVMFPIIQEQANILMKELENVSKTSERLDMKDYFGRFTMDVIAAAAFGINSGSIQNDNAPFAVTAERLFTPTFMENVKLFTVIFFPTLSKMLDLSFSNEAWDFFKKVSTEVLSERRKTGFKRGDFLDLMIDEQKKQENEFNEERDYKVSDDTILAQSAMFLITGYDTTATTLTNTTYLLAKNPHCQDLLREELQSLVENDGKLNYHHVMEAKYLDACISECQRLLPVVPTAERECIKDFQIPDTNYTIPKGMMVQIPIWGLHYDSTFWNDPEEYRPDRFLPENKSEIIPGTHLPFGMGPRNCIAMRFALLEAKLGLAEFVLNYNFSLAPGCEEIELEDAARLIRPKRNSVCLVLNKI